VSTLPLVWMAEALRENGLRVREVQGWRTRGRPHSFLPRGVVFHHTASNRHSGPRPALGTVVKGRPLPDGTFLFGPLCNVLVGRDGVAYLVAAGRANHAGLGGPWQNIPVDSGNMYMAGVEVENDGIGEPWRKELLQVCEVVFATILIGLRRSPAFLVGHKEWAPHRKSDPARIPMDQYRRQVAGRILAIKRPHQGPPAPPSRPPPRFDIYVVRPGDTLFGIATRHDMSVPALMQVNGLSGTLIHPGDKLRVKHRAPQT
jgi:LysM repeat protein